MKKEREKTTSCGAVVWRISSGRLQLLLIKQFKHRDRWSIPKGHIKPEESREDCALREVREETGVNVELGERLPDLAISLHDEDKTIVSWLARPVGADEPFHAGPDSEVADARWFNIDDLPEITAYQRGLIATAVTKLFAASDLR